LEFIKSRRSSKLLTRGSVDLGVVMQALEVAISAANAHNAQPWRFIVIKDRGVMTRLLSEMAAEWRRDLLADGLERGKVEAIISESVRRSERASVMVVVCLTMEDMDKYPDEKRQRCEYVMAAHSIGAVIQNLLLALHALGLGACWRCGPLFAQEAVRRVLGIPGHIEPHALVEIGLPGGVRPMRRRPLSEVASVDRWGEALRSPS